MVAPDDAVVGTDLLARPLTAVLPPAGARALAALGPRTVGDLLRHYPRRYQDRGRASDLSELVPGERVTVIGEVRHAETRRTRTGKAMLTVDIGDGRHQVRMVFFANHPGRLRYHEARLQPGRRAWFSGEVKAFQGGLELLHPAFDTLEEEDDPQRATWPVPVYPSSAALESWAIAKAVATVLDPLRAEEVPDPLPDELRARHGLLPLVDALRQVHRPHSTAEWVAARERLRFEEAFVLQVELARRRARAGAHPAVARPVRRGGLLDAFDARLPFTLTDGQREVGEVIAGELAGTVPMQRLLQGEVGSGKTVVALRAMLQVVDAGGQAALLAPTEVLAGQHLATLRRLLGPLGSAGQLDAAEQATALTLLTGSQNAATRRRALADAASGAAGIVVGTHALLSAGVQLAELGLVVVDEQHRFGVEQRDALRAKAQAAPHTLVMTATPIPRTVAMTVFGDLETSMLTELPAGRAPVTTFVVPADNETWLTRTWTRVAQAAAGGGRAFVVAPRIDADASDGTADLTAAPDEPRPLAAVLDVVDQLRGRAELAGVRIGVLHGRMPAEERDRAFADFASGEVPVLVATTVIEVGVDVPEANVMVVLDADRFGLSQLHQLRGRIGRGTREGLCLLVSHAPDGSDAAVRLAALAATTDGVELARLDLEQRREGDVLGAAQSGTASSLRLLRVTTDEDVILAARDEARALVTADPELDRHPVLRGAIDERLAGAAEEFLDRA